MVRDRRSLETQRYVIRLHQWRLGYMTWRTTLGGPSLWVRLCPSDCNMGVDFTLLTQPGKDDEDAEPLSTARTGHSLLRNSVVPLKASGVVGHTLRPDSNVPAVHSFSGVPNWNSVTVLTARLSDSNAWNHRALRAYWAKTGLTMFLVPSTDAVGPVRSTTLPARPPPRLLEIVVGMPAISTRTGGMTYGHVVWVELDVREPGPAKPGGIYQLQYAPKSVTFKRWDGTEEPFEVQPACTRVTSGYGSHRSAVERTQLALTPVYAVPAHKGSGLTFPGGVIKLGRNAVGDMLFHNYVCSILPVALVTTDGVHPENCKLNATGSAPQQSAAAVPFTVRRGPATKMHVHGANQVGPTALYYNTPCANWSVDMSSYTTEEGSRRFVPLIFGRIKHQPRTVNGGCTFILHCGTTQLAAAREAFDGQLQLLADLVGEGDDIDWGEPAANYVYVEPWTDADRSTGSGGLNITVLCGGAMCTVYTPTDEPDEFEIHHPLREADYPWKAGDWIVASVTLHRRVTNVPPHRSYELIARHLRVLPSEIFDADCQSSIITPSPLAPTTTQLRQSSASVARTPPLAGTSRGQTSRSIQHETPTTDADPATPAAGMSTRPNTRSRAKELKRKRSADSPLESLPGLKTPEKRQREAPNASISGDGADNQADGGVTPTPGRIRPVRQTARMSRGGGTHRD
ncbi:hypothetical protein B0H11DRAFT_1930257 [Mycena galericulata]|nr:hypothetical protein B0H11DRAFT_1930257 [Mycena galericulata]